MTSSDWVLLALAVWGVVSLPFGLFVGRWMKFCDEMDRAWRGAPAGGYCLRCGRVHDKDDVCGRDRKLIS